MKRIDLTNKVFGAWVVLRFDTLKNNNSYWICECQCGKQKSISRTSLINSEFPMCISCSRKRTEKSLIGEIFGKLKVIKEGNKKSYFTCICSCGIQKDIFRGALLSGKSQSCGNFHYEDLIGNIFGRWQVFGISKRKSNKKESKFLICQCECGNTKEVSFRTLKDGQSQSCGCLKSELMSKRSTDRIKKNIKSNKYDWYFFNQEGLRQKCKSSFEVFIWNYFFHILKEKIEYETQTFKIENGKRYTPDFYLPDKNMWIEAKGSVEQYKNGKYQLNKISYLIDEKLMNIKIFYWRDIFKKCELPYASNSSYFHKAKKNNVKIEDYLANMMYMR